MKDPYTTLGVARDATAEQIKRAYHKLARELHPDSHPGDAAAESRFKDISAAYSLLSDKKRRARFDRGEIDASGAEVRRGPRPAGGRSGPFDRFFRHRAGRGAGGPGGGAGPEIKIKGPDVSYGLTIDFLEAATGTVKRIDTTAGKRLDVKVPAGTRDGQVLRLKDQGLPGMGGGPPGSAHVTVTVRPHPSWRTEGSDLHADVAVSLPEAVLGGRIEVETMDGTMAVTVPENSNSGTILRLKGKGLAKDDGSGRGDHFVHLAVALPDKPDKELIEFVRAWAEKHPYEVRRKRSTVA